MNAKEGEMFPAFSLRDDAGNTVTLDSLKGKTTIVYFYPKDDTPGCTTEACNFRDDIGAFRGKGILVYGISVDGIDSHKKFKERYHLNFPLLSDETKTLVEKLGIKSPSGNAQRTTFVLDKNGKIIKIYQNVSPDKHSKELMAFINGLKNN